MSAQVCHLNRAMKDVSTAATRGEQLRSALQKYPAAVTIIALRADNGDFFATTATAVTVLTMDPPTMVCCLNRQSAIAQHIENHKHFSINVLRADQRHIAEACAGGIPHEERERIGEWVDVLPGVPAFANAQTTIVCRRAQFLAYGTHDLLFGEVQTVEVGEGMTPLLYLNRLYGTFQPLPPATQG